MRRRRKTAPIPPGQAIDQHWYPVGTFGLCYSHHSAEQQDDGPSPLCAQLCYCRAGHVPVSGAGLCHGKKNKWLGLKW